MDRSLQSGLEKRTRVGAWQSRVYRLERGYLSAWPDVVSAAAKEQPSRTECLFQDDQVATVTDQGDRRFRLEFPWDSTKTLSLRANNAPMKKAWVELLQATLREAKSQIQSTGSVFAYGGTAQHAEDEAYEEAAYLKTNRFVAAYVVDEQSRASYVNDLLNERFDHVGERAGSGQDVLKACSGANAALEELVALTKDFKEEMLGVEELRRGHGGGEGAGQGDSSVSAPKIAKFCEEHMDLVGRLVASRLMLELSPFMDSSVAGTAAAPTGSTRAELVATRRKLDEAYAATDRLVISGTRAWFMDIRGSFLDCSGLANASSAPPRPPPPPPPPPPAPEAEIAAKDIPTAPPENVVAVSGPLSGSMPAEHVKRPSKLLLANAFSAAKAATKGASMSSSRGKGSSNAKGVDPGQEPRTGGSGLSMRGMFRRGSRTEKEQPVEAKLVSPRKSPHREQARASGEETVPGASPKGARPPETEERERSDLFGGSSRSPTTSPRPTEVSRPSPFSNPSRGTERVGTATSSALPLVSDRSGSLPSINPQPLAPPAGVRKEKRAFAGGLWGSGGSANAEGAVVDAASERVVTTASAAPAPLAATTSARTAEHEAETEGNASSRAERGEPDVSSSPAKPDVPGGKRRFAGGVFSEPPSQSSSSAARSTPQASNPFGAGRSGSTSSVGSGVASSKSGVTTKHHVSGMEKPGTPPNTMDSKPAWANEDINDNAVPDWAVEDSGASVARGGTASPGMGGGQSNGFGLAPPSCEGQGQEAAEKSVFMRVDEDIPPARRPSRRRPGESGSKRAFGGGERLF